MRTKSAKFSPDSPWQLSRSAAVPGSAAHRYAPPPRPGGGRDVTSLAEAGAVHRISRFVARQRGSSSSRTPGSSDGHEPRSGRSRPSSRPEPSSSSLGARGDRRVHRARRAGTWCLGRAASRSNGLPLGASPCRAGSDPIPHSAAAAPRPRSSPRRSSHREVPRSRARPTAWVVGVHDGGASGSPRAEKLARLHRLPRLRAARKRSLAVRGMLLAGRRAPGRDAAQRTASLPAGRPSEPPCTFIPCGESRLSAAPFRRVCRSAEGKSIALSTASSSVRPALALCYPNSSSGHLTSRLHCCGFSLHPCRPGAAQPGSSPISRLLALAHVKS